MITFIICDKFKRLQLIDNKIMIERRANKVKPQRLKTDGNNQTQMTLIEFGKPVKLPNIHKKLNRYHHQQINCQSIQQKHNSSHNKSLIGKNQGSPEVQRCLMRKYSNNSQMNLLTLQQLELCSQRSKKILPKISGLPNCFALTRQNSQRFERQDFVRRLSRMKSEKKTSEHNSFECLKNYKIDGIIGRGNYSVVKLVESNIGKKYAMKIYPKNKIGTPERQANLQRQITIMKQIDHPNIIKFKESIESQQNIYIVMQIFDNCSLADYLKKKSSSQNKKKDKQKKRLDQNVARKIIKQLTESIAYLHNNGIVHRDIKLDNVLIEAQSLKIKLIDFGFSCYDGGQNWHHDYCGTPNYISPQIFKKQGYRGRPADVWALGVLIYHLVVGHAPFKNPSQNSNFNNITSKKSDNSLSQPLLQLLKNMLQNQPQGRWTINQVLKSQWLNIQQ